MNSIRGVSALLPELPRLSQKQGSRQYGIAENMRPADDPKDPALHTENLSPGNHADNAETPNNDSGTSVSFEPVDDQNRALYSR